MWILSWSRPRRWLTPFANSHNMVVNPHHNQCVTPSRSHQSLSRPWRRLTRPHHGVVNPDHNHSLPPSRSHPSRSRPWRRLTWPHHKAVNPHHNHCVPLSGSHLSLSRPLPPVVLVERHGGQPLSQTVCAPEPQPSVPVSALAPVDSAAQPPRALQASCKLNVPFVNRTFE